MVPISGTDNKLRNDEINRKHKERYANDPEYREKIVDNQRRYRKRHEDEIAERRWSGETCEILLNHADEHKDDDDRLTTDFIADQLKKFKSGVYDESELEILKPHK